MADELELRMDATALYREETYTDRRIGIIRVMTPVKTDGSIDLPLEATLQDTTLTVGGRAQKVSNFTLPIGLTGSLSNPKIKVDAKALGNLALKAGTDALKQKAGEKLQEALGDKAGGLLKGLFPEKK